MKGKPLRKVLFGKPLVVFRSKNGSVNILEDRCPHRNAPLSSGKIIDNNIQCPYHGWVFDKNGDCQKIPGLNNKLMVECYKIPNVSAIEKNGLIWGFLKWNNGVTDKPLISPFINSKQFGTFVWEFEIEASIINISENLLDATHTHFVHAGLIRTDKNRQQVEATVRNIPNGIEAEYIEKHPQNGLIAYVFDRNRSSSFGRFILPNIAQLEYQDKKGIRLLLTAMMVPVDESSTRVFICTEHRRSFLPLCLSTLLIKLFFKNALNQDIKILTLQSSNINTFGSEQYKSTKIDLLRRHIEHLLSGKEITSSQDSTVKISL